MEDYYVDYIAETIKNTLNLKTLNKNGTLYFGITEDGYVIIKKRKDRFISEWTNTPITEKQIERVNNIINIIS